MGQEQGHAAICGGDKQVAGNETAEEEGRPGEFDPFYRKSIEENELADKRDKKKIRCQERI